MSGGTLIDLLTDTEARDAVGYGPADSNYADMLRLANTAVSKKLAEACGTIIYGTITAETYDGGRSYIYLRRSPIAQLTQIVEYDSTTAATLTAETNTSKPVSAYWLNTENGKIIRRSGGADAVFPIGRGNITVDYVCGRFTATATVDERFKLAASLTLKNAWRAWESAVVTVGEFDVPHASFPSFMIPNAVKALLGDEWRQGSGIGD